MLPLSSAVRPTLGFEIETLLPRPDGTQLEPDHATVRTARETLTSIRQLGGNCLVLATPGHAYTDRLLGAAGGAVLGYAEATRWVQESWDQKRSATELNVTVDKFKEWQKAGRLPGRQYGRSWRYSPADILAIKEQLYAFPPGFEWLSDAQAPYLNQLQVLGRLGIGSRTAGSGRRKEYCLSATSQLGRRVPNYPKKYIQGLLAFAGSKPVTLGQAREYSGLCEAAQRIV